MPKVEEAMPVVVVAGEPPCAPLDQVIVPPVWLTSVPIATDDTLVAEEKQYLPIQMAFVDPLVVVVEIPILIEDEA